MDISVIIPVYNVERYLKGCLDSVISCVEMFKKGGRDAEIVCVNDGSTDGSADILEAFEEDARHKGIVFKTIKQPNLGLSAARNAGLDVATGKWITFVDSDDCVAADYLVRLFSAVDAAGCKIAAIGDEWKEGSAVPSEDYWCANRTQATVAWGKLYAASLLSGVRFPEGRFHEDEFVTYRLVFGQGKVATVKGNIYHYAVNPGSIMLTPSKGKLRDELEACDRQMDFFRGKFFRAYALTLANRIRICHGMGVVRQCDVDEYRRCAVFSLNSFYWAEHYRHPFLVNSVTWRIMRLFYLVYTGKLLRYLHNWRRV